MLAYHFVSSMDCTHLFFTWLAGFKKTALEPIISNTLSTILELYILDASMKHVLSSLQFGFVSGRGTDMVTSLANDVFPIVQNVDRQFIHVHRGCF